MRNDYSKEKIESSFASKNMLIHCVQYYTNTLNECTITLILRVSNFEQYCVLFMSYVTGDCVA